MHHETIALPQQTATGYVVPLGAVNMVFAVTAGGGLLGCGVFDVAALDRFQCPAVKVQSATGRPIATVDDLLGGRVKAANETALRHGVSLEMDGRQALERI